MSSQDLVRKRKRKIDRQQGNRNFLTQSKQLQHSPAKKRYTKNEKKAKVRFPNRTPVEDNEPEFSASISISEDKRSQHTDSIESNHEDLQDNDEGPDEVRGNIDETDESSEILKQQDDEMKAVKEELSQMSFEELQQLKDKLGTKMFNQVMHGQKRKVPQKPTERQKAEFKRTNKKRPMEISSKKTVARYRQIIPVKKKMFRDPRFDDLSGEYKEEIFQQSYSFINDVKDRERVKLQKQLKKEKDPETKAKIKSVLNRMKQQQRTEQDKTRRQEQERVWLQKEKELVSQGKRPYFLKKSDKRKLELADKYRELQKSGKLEKYLSKKRKKNSQKQRRKMIDL